MRPVLLIDGDCSFCWYWVKRWQKAIGDAIGVEPYQSSAIPRQYGISEAALARAVHFVDPASGSITRGADAVFSALTYSQRMGIFCRLWNRHAWFRLIARAGYWIIARNRGWLWKFMKLFGAGND